jgi:hypothetical protein
MTIDRSSDRPVYKQVADALRLATRTSELPEPLLRKHAASTSMVHQWCAFSARSTTSQANPLKSPTSFSPATATSSSTKSQRDSYP